MTGAISNDSARSGAPQQPQKLLRRQAVRLGPDRALEGADGVNRVWPHDSVDLLYSKALAPEAALHLLALVKAQRIVAARPACLDGRAARDPVCKVPHTQRIGIGVVVTLDDVEIGKHHERRSLGPRRLQDSGRAVVAHRAPVDPDNTARGPVRGHAARVAE